MHLGPLTAKNVPIGIYTPTQLTFPALCWAFKDRRKGASTDVAGKSQNRGVFPKAARRLCAAGKFLSPAGRASASALPGELNRASPAPLGPRVPQEEPQKRRSLEGVSATATTLLMLMAVNGAGSGVGWGHGAGGALRRSGCCLQCSAARRARQPQLWCCGNDNGSGTPATAPWR